MWLREHGPTAPGDGARLLVGMGSGAVSGLAVGALMAWQDLLAGHGTYGWAVFALYAAVTGELLGGFVGRRPSGPAVSAAGGLLLGLLGWAFWWLTVDPLIQGAAPTWSIAAATAVYPELVGSLLQGTLAGLLFHAAVRRFRDRPAKERPRAPRVVVIGGGFGGVGAARRFERLNLRGHRIDVTLVSDSNHLLFTPMLAEVASGGLEERHITSPVRAAVAHTRFRHGRVAEVDAARRVVRLEAGEALPYDHLVLAVGSVPHFPDLPGVAENACTLKSLSDAVRLRDRVLMLLERADQEDDPAERARLLTFVVAGGGFAGTETVAELYDLTHDVLHFYPGIDPGEPRFVLVHSGARVLPELSDRLGEYAQGKLRARGIEFRLGVRVAAAGARDVRLSDGAVIPAGTFVWTAGNRPSPLVRALAGDGPVPVDRTLRAFGLDGVWAIGDCARIPAPDGSPYPPTAQHAAREGRAVADNIAAVLKGRRPAPFRFRTLGVFVALGHRTAAGQIRGRPFSGLSAWLLWRGIYLAKLPGIDRRVRVLLDWGLDLVFPRDIVVTGPSAEAPVPARGVR
ncbi:NAD(P)/FAD-dependent oxidoreductase [Actinomadura madurae]|uniref:NAD(P)/FAD-dependent oxidoreductase n=1 Tax=Actinomadura madurae TaxID=1993 RepID=UPI0020D215D3|nr:NAD(P)/FAD-dependent oxidoreductase [Actinomadura madurae]MCP9952234.1 NAD(P)/FAD-dependent oxidoreductase [Actinomadura madurae]MCQ0007018.1 NAD(P)/FAD-dependent oxidoreductase [Actinomadura madurae]MCQ0017673.1 NAD(P)/FAD-dependent oxidoreductase [Actinomadura madurae]